MVITHNHENLIAESAKEMGAQTKALSNKFKWQLALERAYLDFANQYTQMGTPKQMSVESRKLPSKCGVGSNGNESAGERVDVHYVSSKESESTRSNSNYMPEQVSVAGMSDQIGREARTKNILSAGNTYNKVTREYTQNHREVQISREASRTLKIVDKEFMQLIKLEKGILLNIRSDVLSGEMAIRMSREVCRRLNEKGFLLEKIVLNGQVIWKAAEIHCADQCEYKFDEHQLNMTY